MTVLRRGIQLTIIYTVCLGLLVGGMTLAHQNSSATAYADTAPPFVYSSSSDQLSLVIFDHKVTISKEVFRQLMAWIKQQDSIRLPAPPTISPEGMPPSYLNTRAGALF